jgi:hypothetical protein
MSHTGFIALKKLPLLALTVLAISAAASSQASAQSQAACQAQSENTPTIHCAQPDDKQAGGSNLLPGQNSILGSVSSRNAAAQASSPSQQGSSSQGGSSAGATNTTEAATRAAQDESVSFNLDMATHQFDSWLAVQRVRNEIDAEWRQSLPQYDHFSDPTKKADSRDPASTTSASSGTASTTTTVTATAAMLKKLGIGGRDPSRTTITTNSSGKVTAIVTDHRTQTAPAAPKMVSMVATTQHSGPITPPVASAPKLPQVPIALPSATTIKAK